MKPRLPILAFLLLLTSIVHAQEMPLPALEPITAENAGRLTEVMRYGKGIVGSEPTLRSPDGKTLAITSSLGVWLYDTEQWHKTPKFLQIDSGGIYDVVFSPDSHSLAVVNWPFWYGVGQTVTVWDVVTGQKRFNLYPGTVTGGLDYSPDGTLIGTGNNGGEIQLLDAQSGELRASIKAHETGSVADVVFSPDGEWIASSSEDWRGPGTIVDPSDGSVRFWKVSMALHEGSLSVDDADIEWNDAGGAVYNLRFSQNSQTLSYQMPDCCVAVQNVVGHPLKREFITNSITFIDNHVLYQDNDSVIDYNPKTGIAQKVFDADYAVRFDSLDSANVAYWVSGGNMLHTWKDNVQKTVRLHEAQNLTTGFLHNDTFLTVLDSGIQVWNAETGMALATLSGYVGNTRRSSTAIFSPEADLLAYSLGDHDIHLTDTTTGLDRLRLSGDIPLTFSPDGNLLLFERGDATILWDLETNAEVAELVKGLPKFSPDGTKLAIATDVYDYQETPDFVNIYDLATEQLIFTINEPAHTMLFNSDASRLMLANRNQIAIWDLATLQQISTFTGGEAWQTNLDFRPNGRAVATQVKSPFAGSLCCSTSLEIFDVSNGRRRHITEFPADERNEVDAYYPDIFDVIFSPSGNLVAFSTISFWDDVSLYIWDLRSNERRTIPGGRLVRNNLTFGADESLLLFTGDDYLRGGAADLDRSVYVIDVVTNTSLAVLPGHNDPPTSVAISQDNRLIVSTSIDGTVRVWGVPRQSP